MANMYLCLLGKKGIREVAEQNLAKAEYAKQKIADAPKFSIPFSGPTFNEFVVTYDGDLAKLLEKLEGEKILGGIALQRFFDDLPNSFLVCTTEQHRKEDIDRLVDALKGGAA
jgi:glycine dehydrogenase subunit 1